MNRNVPKAELAERVARLVPEVFILAENSALRAIRSVQWLGWLGRRPAIKQLSKVKLEFLGFSFFYLDYQVFRCMGADVRDEFMDDLVLFALHGVTDGMDEGEAEDQRRWFVRLVNTHTHLYAQYDKVLTGPHETPDGTALWWFSVYLLQTIEGHALNQRHRAKVYEVALECTKSLDTLLADTLPPV